MIINNLEEAQIFLQREILSKSSHDFVIIDRNTIEKDYGWIFFYTTRRYLETSNPSFLVPGTAPMVVTRAGEIARLSSSVPPPQAIAMFEAEWRRARDARTP